MGGALGCDRELIDREVRKAAELLRSGAIGAFRMGAEHGLYCLGCCWALMLLLFTAGVMNLLWVAMIAALVFVEKLLPMGHAFARGSGCLMVVVGLYWLVAAA